jgi:hemerythrin-like domain-containing protein
MCDYCGCRTVPAIALLTREHDHMVNLVSHVRAAHERGDVAAMAKLARRIAATLGPHTAVEEAGLFPALAAEFPGQIERLTDEHRHIERVLGEATGSGPADPDWPARLMAALWQLREHILDEQDDVFPTALSRLDPEDWAAIDAIRDRVGRTLPSTPAPDNAGATSR